MPLAFKDLAVDEDRRDPTSRRHVARLAFAGTVNGVALDLTIVLTVPRPPDETIAGAAGGETRRAAPVTSRAASRILRN
ncbi:MAG TPA: hypothetical protein PKA55_10945 [Rhodoblastus sp.]|nr:hypothetical protein [Rhodoblastus sp.]